MTPGENALTGSSFSSMASGLTIPSMAKLTPELNSKYCLKYGRKREKGVARIPILSGPGSEGQEPLALHVTMF
jgi:hypothetical protein